VWAVAGPQLVRRLNKAQTKEDYPCRFALVRAVLDWYRTGMITPLPWPIAGNGLSTALRRAVLSVITCARFLNSNRIAVCQRR
jgi:hypothetical protein